MPVGANRIYNNYITEATEEEMSGNDTPSENTDEEDEEEYCTGREREKIK